MRSEEEFLSRFGDMVGLILALITSVLLRHSALAAWTIWPATVTICLVIAWISSPRRS